MYYAYFGLTHAPFKITPDTEVFFEGGNRGAILEALVYAISQGEGIIKVTGEVGSGKTMLCRMLQTRVPENVETVYLANPSVSPDEILHAIAFEMQLGISKEASRLEVMHKINEHLLERHSQRKQVVLFVEESQGIPIETLEEIRLLSNLETNQHKLLQIALFGQPELDDKLRKPEIRQLRERITHSFTLSPLTAEDIRAYISFRLQAAGYRGPDLFSRRVVEQIARVSAGLTRRINIVADKALLAAFADGTHNVSLQHVRAAIRDSEFAGPASQKARSPVAYAVGGLVIGGLLGAGAFALFQALSPAPEAEPGAAVSDANRMSVQETAAAPAASPMPTPPVPETAAAPLPADNPSESGPALAPEAGQDPEVPATAAAAPAGSGKTPAEAATASNDLLEQRLLAAEAWLAETSENRYSIQLLGSEDPELLRNYLNTISNYLEINKVFVYRTIAKERPYLTVLYGSFGSRREANAQIEALPRVLKANRPYYRTVGGVRAEIAMHNS
jgi:MSHA biogenesis protein MshM